MFRKIQNSIEDASISAEVPMFGGKSQRLPSFTVSLLCPYRHR